MAKTRAPRAPKTSIPPKVPAIDPKRVHELLGIPGPYLDVEQPPDRPNALTFWDAGCSINTLLAKAPDLFNKNHWFKGEEFAKRSDSWRWRQVTLTAAEPGETYADQEKKLKVDEQVPLARERVRGVVPQPAAGRVPGGGGVHQPAGGAGAGGGVAAGVQPGAAPQLPGVQDAGRVRGGVSSARRRKAVAEPRTHE